MSEPSVEHVPDRHRFEIAVDGTPAGLTRYVEDDGRRIFFHTEVGEEYGGQGLAATLVAAALDRSRADGLRIVAMCPYVAAYVKRHPEYEDLIEPVTPADTAAVEAATRPRGDQ